jgi:hypothetical protein
MLRVRRFTMLTSSETWFTTHAIVSLSAATATGSRPTEISPSEVRVPDPGAKIWRRASGVLTARSFAPSGVIASGRTWSPSKFT